MIRLVMIPVVMILAAMIMLYVDGHRDQWARDSEIRWLIRKNRQWERMIEEVPNKRMSEQYAVCMRRK